MKVFLSSVGWKQCRHRCTLGVVIDKNAKCSWCYIVVRVELQYAEVQCNVDTSAVIVFKVVC